MDRLFHRGASLKEASKIVCLLALALQGVDAFMCPGKYWCCNPPNPDPQPKPPAKCGGPVEGVWLQEHWVPRLPCQSTLMLESRTRIWLEQEFDSVYFGNGSGTILIVPFLPPNSTIYFLTIFDDEACTHAGVIYNFDVGLSLPFQWVLFPRKQEMEGAYVNLVSGQTYLSTRSQFRVTYEGSLPG